MPVELSIIIPTYKEKGNIRPLLGQITEALKGVSWEAIFVDDDSPDGTAYAVREIARQDTRVRCIQRVGRRGLSSAAIEGMLSSAAPYMAVMDADLQHDATLLPKMLEALKTGSYDIVIGSRYVDGGGIGDWTAHRAMMSRFATGVGRLVLRADIKDPMSGYFMLQRPFFHQVVHRLSGGKGFKILLDICASSPHQLRFKELSFRFGQRLTGESKLGQGVLFEFLRLILLKLPARICGPKSQ